MNKEIKIEGIFKFIIRVVFLPIFLTWYVWKRTGLRNRDKVVATFIIFLLAIFIIPTDEDALRSEKIDLEKKVESLKAELDQEKQKTEKLTLEKDELTINQEVKGTEEVVEEPQVETKEEIKIEEVGFKTVKQNDYSILEGETEVKQEGQNGEKQIKYEVTYENGEETGRELISEEITVEPVDEIILVGKKVAVEVVSTPVSSSSSYTCNCSKTCPQMSSCAEAQYQLNVCGCSRRDADHDGIACDADCQ